MNFLPLSFSFDSVVKHGAGLYIIIQAIQFMYK